MVMEPREGTLAWSSMDRKPIFEHSTLRLMKLQADYGAVNAIWHSMTTTGMRNVGDRKAYLKLCGVLLTALLGEDDWNGEQESITWDPLHLAKGLHEDRIDLGIVFGDDTSVVVWPLGKINTSAIIIFCVLQVDVLHGGGKSTWRYRAIDAATDSPEPSTTAGASDYLFNHGRNSDGLGWWDHNQRLVDFSLPEICAVNRQIFLEVAPVWLLTRSFSIQVPTHRPCGPYGFRMGHARIAAGALSAGNSCIGSLPSEAHVQELVYHLSAGTKITILVEGHVDVNISRGYSSLRAEKYADGLRELAESLLDSKGTGGLSPADAAVIADFIWSELRENEIY
ncbi:hypothetical protein LTR27_006890 [Elasticomyces elasticus]|nr:hypothetical protein LTR27_006890 [Elasticomyces elasticus]